MNETVQRRRRIYREGTCQDCGRTMPVTVATWWVSGFKMNLCKDCIKAYRKVLLKP